MFYEIKVNWTPTFQLLKKKKNDCCMPWRRRKAASFIHYQTKQKQQHITKNLKLLTLHQSNFYYIAYKKRTNQHY
jgi:hypothetical protein